MKKSISLLVAALVMFAMTAVSFAENSADINVTSEPIRWHAECDKAGGLAISFDHGTQFVSGDQITADLPLNVSLCRNIDFIAGISRANMDPLPYSEFVDFGLGVGVLPSIGDRQYGPLTATVGSELQSTSGGVVFWVHGTIGSQRIYIDILSDSNNSGIDRIESSILPSLTYDASSTNDEQTAKLVLNILDQAVYTSPSGLFTDRDFNVAPYYDEPAAGDQGTAYDLPTTASENTLCINVSEYNNEYVKLSFDSKDDKYKWIPSDPQVAHVVSAMAYGFAPCSKNECGRIEEPTPGEQSAGVCQVIDNEYDDGSDLTEYADGGGYCPGTHRNNRLIVTETSGKPFDAGMYQIQLEILVDGQTGDQGAYFDGPIGYNTTTSPTVACSMDADYPDPIYFDSLGYSNGVYQIDSEGTNSALMPSSSDDDCSIDADNRITKVRTVETSMFNGADRYLFIDIPNIVWDSTLFTTGEKLEVRVTLMRAPCQSTIIGDWCIGTLGCEEDEDEGTCWEYSRVFPYFGAAGAFANYMSITNTSSSPVTYTVEIFEKDGDQFTATVMVGAQSLAVVNLHSLTVTAVSDAGGGVFGNSQSYAVVKGSAAFYGGAYMINATSGQAFDAPIGDIAKTKVDCP